MKKKFEQVKEGDIIRLPKLNFRITDIIEVESQSSEEVLEVHVIGTTDPFRGMKGRFLVLESDKVEIAIKNSWLNRMYYWFFPNNKVSVTQVQTTEAIPYNPFH